VKKAVQVCKLWGLGFVSPPLYTCCNGHHKMMLKVNTTFPMPLPLVHFPFVFLFLFPPLYCFFPLQMSLMCVYEWKSKRRQHSHERNYHGYKGKHCCCGSALLDETCTLYAFLLHYSSCDIPPLQLHLPHLLKSTYQEWESGCDHTHPHLKGHQKGTMTVRKLTCV